LRLNGNKQRGLGRPELASPAAATSCHAPPRRAARSTGGGALRQWLRGGGFVQTTLTNVERAEFQGEARRFLYEGCSRGPERFGMPRFGRSAIGFAADRGFRRGLKTLNPDSSADYRAAVDRGGRVWDRGPSCGGEDLRVFYLTGRLAKLEIDRRGYQDTFGGGPVTDFSREFQALQAEQLAEVTPEAIRPTPRGMFYADPIAWLLAFRRLRALRRRRLGAKSRPPRTRWGRGRSEAAS
jgi:hypothetical protein